MKLRIGAVPYGVGTPLAAGLRQQPGIELVTDVPSKLIERLRAGQLEAGLVSSIEAFRRPGYRALPELGICCRGAVGSVRAFWRPPGLDRVALDSASESSVALLKLLLARNFPRARPTFERVQATDRPDAMPHDLVLLIGDNGFRADPGRREVWDLGAMWQAWTGLPFVFALWLIAPSAPLDEVAAALRAAHRTGSDKASGQGAVHYDIGPDERNALERFHAEAARIGLAEQDLYPTFAHEPMGDTTKTTPRSDGWVQDR